MSQSQDTPPSNNISSLKMQYKILPHIQNILHMMAPISQVAILILLITLSTSNQHLNIKYRQILSGQSELTARIAQQIYQSYISPYFKKSDYRFQIFYTALQKIKQHNNAGTHTWSQGINDFTDMTFQEFKRDRLMEPQECSATNSIKIKKQFKNAPLPDNYQWNDYGLVSAVKDQGNCGSCWSFSTVGAIESHWNILGKGRNITFSEQQLVDCAGDYENYGCEGGLPSHAFEYIRHSGGIESDITYPYTAHDGKCVHRPEISVGYVRHGSYNITQGDQNQLAQRLYNAGPISIAYQVISDFFRYSGGIYTTKDCGTTTMDVNHAVLATGFGVENGIKYWNVKNSWSTEWGVKGYFKIQRDVNMCAIAQCNAYPLIDNFRDFVAIAEE